MMIRDGSQSLEVTLRERGPAGTQSEGDLGFNIAVVCATFSGRNETVWIQGPDWNQFTEQLAQLERTRQGEAVVFSMGPHDFRLKVFASDRAGHIAAEGWVGRDWYGRREVLEDRVSFAIEIDPSTLPLLSQQFDALPAA